MASAYLTSNTGTATNAKKFTLSMWIKRGKLSDATADRFYQGYKDSNNRFYVMFDNTNSNPDTLWIYAVTGGTVQVYWTSARKFKDTTGWYHFVFSADSTLGTAADRLKVYVNGVLETSFTKNNNPASNIDWGNQLAQTNNDLTLSGTETQTQLFDGQMAHVNFVDGQALAPTEFGETDTTTGIWKPKSAPSVTYGNNGYFLKFDNSANMGLDSSGQGNNFTVNGTIIQTKDTPSNVFNTFNPLENYYDNGTFSNTNSTYQTNNSTYSRNTSTLGMAKGKYYWEVKIAAVNQQSDYFPHVGITSTQITGNQDFVGKMANDYSWGTNSDGSNVKKWNNNQQTAYGTNFAVGDIVGVALDLDNNKLYFSKSGTFQESGDPTSGSTGTGAAFTVTAAASTPLGAYFPSVSNYDGTGNATFQANFGNGYFGTTAVSSAQNPDDGVGIFEYDVPAGYRAICTKSLNAQEYS